MPTLVGTKKIISINNITIPKEGVDWVNGAQIALDHTNDLYWRTGSGLISFSRSVSFSRNSIAYRALANGAYEKVNINEARRDTSYSPIGLLIEPEQINGVPNSALVGAVIGSPGSPPTGWLGWTTNSGMFAQQTNLLTVNDIPCVQFDETGTATGGGVLIASFGPQGVSGFSVIPGETIVPSILVKKISGSYPNYTLRLQYFNSSGTQIGNVDTNMSPDGTLKRFIGNPTIVPTAAAFVTLQFRTGLVSSSTYTISLIFGSPQIEKTTFASSPIPMISRAAEILTIDVSNIGLRTISCDFRLLGYINGSTEVTILQTDDGTNNNRARIVYIPSTGKLRGQIKVGGVDQADLELGDYIIGSRRQAALSWNLNQFRGALDGNSQVESISGMDLIGIKTIRYGIDANLIASGHVIMSKVFGYANSI